MDSPEEILKAVRQLEPKRKTGRPSIYSAELVATICQRMAEGESLNQICKDPEMPAYSTVMAWAAEKEDFKPLYAEARAALLEFWAGEIVSISDDGSNDWIEREVNNGRVMKLPDNEHINRSRLRVDTRKWLLSKLAPKKYGDSTTIAHTGADGGPIHTAGILGTIADGDAMRAYLEMLKQ